MADKLEYKSKIASVSVEISENKRMVAIFYQSGKSRLPRTVFEKIAEFDICLVWDMIRDAVATVDVDFVTNPGLFRRKGEAAAGILHTNELFMKEGL